MRKIERTPEAVLRTAFENALRFRGTKYLIIDEAHHLLYARGGIETAAAMLDSLKCLAARTQVVLILVAAYPVIRLLSMLPHLSGRKLQIHFPRYRANTESDVFEFDRILLQYSQLLRFAGSQSLRDWNDFLYSGSLGCIGLLRRWLRSALTKAWIVNAAVISREHFESSRMSDLDLESLLREITIGEESLCSALVTPVAIEQPGEPTKEGEKRRRGRPFAANPRRFVVTERRKTDEK